MSSRSSLVRLSLPVCFPSPLSVLVSVFLFHCALVCVSAGFSVSFLSACKLFICLVVNLCLCSFLCRSPLGRSVFLFVCLCRCMCWCVSSCVNVLQVADYPSKEPMGVVGPGPVSPCSQPSAVVCACLCRSVVIPGLVCSFSM